MKNNLVKSLVLLVIGLLTYANNLYSQTVTDTPSYFDATIHYPSELNARVETRSASFALFERVYTSHMEDISLNVTMYVDRAYDGSMDTYLSDEYNSLLSSIFRQKGQITYKTYNREKKLFIVSWKYNGVGYYQKCHLRRNALYVWTLSWDITDSDTHRRAKAYLDNRQIYFTW